MAVDNNDAAKKARLKSVLLLMLPLVALGVIVKYRYVPEAERVRLAPDRHVTAKLDAILSSNAPDAARRKALIEFGYTSAEFENALRKRFPDAMMVDRVSAYVQLGYHRTDPLPPLVFDKAAKDTCRLRYNKLRQSSPTFDNDVYHSYNAARIDLEAWRDYVDDFDVVVNDCASNFRFLVEQRKKKLDGELTMKNVGSKVGEASAQIGHWWDSATKPLSDAVSDFRSGYESGRN